jgi:CrcB protein
MSALWIGLGGALGSIARYFLSEAMARTLGPEFPWGTLFVNVSGSLVIGFVAGWDGADGRLMESAFARQFVMVGICGGYTTFSAFSLQTLEMLQVGDVGRAGGYAAASVLTCVLAAWAGYALAATLSRTA